MHEFSIVQSIIDIAEKTAREHQAGQIASVEVEIGQAAGVVQEALEFAWESAIKDTMLNRASLVVKSIPVELACRHCGTHYSPEEIYETCPVCGKTDPEILKGLELRVSAIVT
jgi:hydrogenase nickel incorporation protein HypA/HybF